MIKIRLAKVGEEKHLKRLWKVCFGDEDTYIDIYFNHMYKPERTAVLLWEEEVVAMTTMIPAHMVMIGGERFDLSMFYAVATHPSFQGKGLSTKIMDFCHAHLKNQNKNLSILVPAQESLFNFYSKRGYTDGFYIREIELIYDKILNFKQTYESECSVYTLAPNAYNKRRQAWLKGYPYIDYHEDEIAYQKVLCKQYGGDLYAIDMGGHLGCAVIERINQDKVLIKELLIKDHLIKESIKQITKILPAQSYFVRLPVFLGGSLGGSTRHFGMIKSYKQNTIIPSKQIAYLGIAYD